MPGVRRCSIAETVSELEANAKTVAAKQRNRQMHSNRKLNRAHTTHQCPQSRFLTGRRATKLPCPFAAGTQLRNTAQSATYELAAQNLVQDGTSSAEQSRAAQQLLNA